MNPRVLRIEAGLPAFPCFDCTYIGTTGQSNAVDATVDYPQVALHWSLCGNRMVKAWTIGDSFDARPGQLLRVASTSISGLRGMQRLPREGRYRNWWKTLYGLKQAILTHERVYEVSGGMDVT